MHHVRDPRHSSQLDLSQSSASKSRLKWAKGAMSVGLVVVFAYAVIAAEVQLLDSGAPVVVMPE
jgi:hypothetical protein